MWPRNADALLERQRELALLAPATWHPGTGPLRSAGCWASFPRGESGPGRAGDLAWTSAALLEDTRTVARRVAPGAAHAGYVPGLLALRLGALLEQVVGLLPRRPDVLLVDATGRDHPRGAGLAVHLGAELGLPTIGVTHRPLLAEGRWPADQPGAHAPLALDGRTVAAWVRTRAGTRPLVVHSGWRTDVGTAVDVVTRLAVRRTPEPLRVARQAAREARARSSGRS